MLIVPGRRWQLTTPGAAFLKVNAFDQGLDTFRITDFVKALLIAAAAALD